MIVAVALGVLIVALGVASVLGWTVDTRDPDYGLGRVLQPRDSDEATGNLRGDAGPRSSVDRAAAF